MNLDQLKEHIERGGKMFLRNISYDANNERLELIVGPSLNEGNAIPVIVESATDPGQLEKGYEIYGISYYLKLEHTEIHINMERPVKFRCSNSS